MSILFYFEVHPSFDLYGTCFTWFRFWTVFKYERLSLDSHVFSLLFLYILCFNLHLFEFSWTYTLFMFVMHALSRFARFWITHFLLEHICRVNRAVGVNFFNDFFPSTSLATFPGANAAVLTSNRKCIDCYRFILITNRKYLFIFDAIWFFVSCWSSIFFLRCNRHSWNFHLLFLPSLSRDELGFFVIDVLHLCLLIAYLCQVIFFGILSIQILV